MRVLTACEFTGRVRDAFRRLGHDAWSCDLLPTEGDPRYHIQGDVLDVLEDGWDLMIAHPPCTYLTVAGAAWFNQPGRQEKQKEALDFVRSLMDAPIPRIAIENPVSVISTKIREPDQIITPCMFGEPYPKTTCLWLKNLPKLKPTNLVKPIPDYVVWVDKRSGKIKKEHKWIADLRGSKNRQSERSRTFQGVADAMASQWSRPYPIQQCLTIN